MKDNVTLTGTKRQQLLTCKTGEVLWKYILCHYLVKSDDAMFLNYVFINKIIGTSVCLCFGKVEKYRKKILG